MKTNQVYWGHFQLQLNNMLVKKMKWLNLHSISKLDDVTNLPINFAVTARAEKHGMPNMKWRTNDIPNHTDTWKTYSSLYPVITEDHLPAYSKKKLKEL